MTRFWNRKTPAEIAEEQLKEQLAEKVANYVTNGVGKEVESDDDDIIQWSTIGHSDDPTELDPNYDINKLDPDEYVISEFDGLHAAPLTEMPTLVKFMIEYAKTSKPVM